MSVQWWPKYTLLVGLTGRETGVMDHSSRFQGAARSSRQVAATAEECQTGAVEAARFRHGGGAEGGACEAEGRTKYFTWPTGTYTSGLTG